MKLLEKINAGEVYVIAEMSGNHGGDLEHALEIVRAAAEAGADCLKTQTYTPDSITLNCNNKIFQIENGLWKGRTLYDLYSEAHTPFEWQPIIKEECDRLGIDFLSSVFDFSSVDYLEEIEVEAYKIASPELVDIPLIEYAAKTNKPIIISSGMATLEEIQEALEACYQAGNKNVVLLKCTSEYPAIYEDMNIATIADMIQRFKCPIGLSDHSMGYAVDIAAVALGASVVEKHFCVSRDNETVDSVFSMDANEFAEMVKEIKLAKKAIGKVNYTLSEQEKTSLPARRSLFASKNISKGEVFTESNVRSVRPSNGVAPKYYKILLGTIAKRDIEFGEPILLSDLHGEKPPVVTLEPISQLETQQTFEWVQHPWYVEEFSGQQVTDFETHQKYIETMINKTQNWQNSGQVFLAAYFNGEHIGNAGIKNIKLGEGEVWYYVGSSSTRGKGIGSAIVKALIDYGINKCNINTLYARVNIDNQASCRVLEKNGFFRAREVFDEDFQKSMYRYEFSKQNQNSSINYPN